MNWKLLGTMVTLIGVGASVALGQGTTPTIVQGDYISNVFGNSNFIKNPNAKLNNANVTASNATVTRSTTTPLVATSEFNITTSTSTGYADWSTRTFDSGMKGQNCEARFSYRGFSVGSTTAQILQGANVVAQLTLTPSTDPRIASINFPCGDLSSATTFRLQQATASLTGTNEIGGIYVGLATNMANVAQAEMYGAVQWAGCALPEPVRTGSTAFGNFAGGGTCSSKTLFGKATSANEADGSVTFNNLPAGYYFLQTNTFAYIATPSGAGIVGQIEAYEDTSGTASGRSYIQAQVASVLSSQPTPSGWFYFSSTANRTFRLRATISNAAQSVNLALGYSGSPEISQFALYRFPSSSELVVTPERQNVFGSVSWTNTGTAFQSISTNTFTSGNSTIFGNANATTYGAASATGNTSEITITNMPVGTFRIMYNGSLFANSGGSATNADCSYRIRETSTSTTLAQNSGAGIPGQNADFTITNIEGVYRNTSVATRTFRVEIAMLAPTTGIVAQRCGFLGQTNTTGASGGSAVGQPTMIVQPLDQPSNSALYVEGPVKASATGAAIPSGYQMQGVANANNAALTNGELIRDVSTFVPGARALLITRTLTPGNYLVSADISCDGMPSGIGLVLYMVADTTTFGVARNVSPVASAYVSNSLTRYLRVTNNMVYKVEGEAGGVISGTCATVSTIVRLN